MVEILSGRELAGSKAHARSQAGLLVEAMVWNGY